MRREIGRRTTDSNVFYDKSLHPEYVLDVCLRCIVDTLRGKPCTGIYEYRDETFKHDAFLVVLLSFRSHSKASFFPLSPSILLCFCFCRARREKKNYFASWHAYVLFFIDRLVLRFLFTFSLCSKSKSLTHVLCVLLHCLSLVESFKLLLLLLLLVFLSFLHHNTPLCISAVLSCIHDLH